MLNVDKLETVLIGLRVEILSGLSGILFEAFLGRWRMSSSFEMFSWDSG